MDIRIIRRPFGEAPEWIGDAWVGLVLPTPQRSARKLRGLPIRNGRGDRLSRLWATICGKSFPIQGFVVDARIAIGLLEMTQPLAAEWWRENASDWRYLIFDEDCCEPVEESSPALGNPWVTHRSRDSRSATPGYIALIWIIANLIRVATAMVFPDQLALSVPTIVYQGTTPILAALLAGWVLRLRGSTMRLLADFVALDVLMAIIMFMAAFFLAEADDIENYHAYRLLLGFHVIALAVLILRGVASRRSPIRQLAACLLAIGTTIGAGYLPASYSTLWQLSAIVRPYFGQPAPEDGADSVMPDIEADRLWGAQPGLIGAALAGLSPRNEGRTNVYAVAVAGSGVQALFSREAHEALKVTSRHFGTASRGGVLLSNATVNLMQSPLATRDNMAATARGLGGKVDHRQDILFLYLTSHGSQAAELSTDLADFTRFQPISAVSTAKALDKAGISRRVIVISACYAASWIPALANDDTIIIAAAARDRTSFGCDDTRQMTLFGEIFLSGMARSGLSLHEIFERTRQKIAVEERKLNLTPSLPQAHVGRNMEGFWNDRTSTFR